MKDEKSGIQVWLVVTMTSVLLLLILILKLKGDV